MKKGFDLMHDLEFQVAQLDLLASVPMRRIANDLCTAHFEERFRLEDAESGEEDVEGRVAVDAKVDELTIAFVERARADLGLGLAKPPRSLLGMLLAAISSP